MLHGVIELTSDWRLQQVAEFKVAVLHKGQIPEQQQIVRGNLKASLSDLLGQN